jgi:hypothetical protein
MTLALTDAQLAQVQAQLFLLKPAGSSKLPKPHSVSAPVDLAVRMQPIGDDPRFKTLGIGVVDFTADMANPKIWLHKEDEPWRMASTGKIAILLAAVQLRDDVRKIKALNIISTPAEFDELFASPKVWNGSHNSKVRQIASKAAAPRISTIFDLTLPQPDFIGSQTPLDKVKLGAFGFNPLHWPGVPDLTFWELLWTAGTQSDDVAATACVSDIGVDYMKAVQRAYGLFDDNHNKGMRMLLAQGYDTGIPSTPVNRSHGAPKYRELQHQESNFTVNDVYIDPRTGVATRASGQSGSAAALTAYMIALMQNGLVTQGGVAGSGADGCNTILTLLADETGLVGHTDSTTTSLILEGVHGLGVAIPKAHTKLGILGSLRCEFAYLEAGGLKYAVIAMGLLPRNVGGAHIDEVALGHALGAAIHTALTAP